MLGDGPLIQFVSNKEVQYNKDVMYIQNICPTNKEVVLASEVYPGDDSTKPFRIVYHTRFGKRSTHMETLLPNGETDGFHNGDYEATIQDYEERCKKHNLNPYPAN